MRISEAHSFTRQPITMRRRSLTAGMGEVPVTEVVGKDDDDVGRTLLSLGVECKGKREQNQECAHGLIVSREELVSMKPVSQAIAHGHDRMRGMRQGD